jgi:hypothetical protein
MVISLRKWPCLLLAIVFMGCGPVMAQWNEDATRDTTLTSVRHWFEAWELVSNDVYGLHTLEPVNLLFFDDTNIYTTSKEFG